MCVHLWKCTNLTGNSVGRDSNIRPIEIARIDSLCLRAASYESTQEAVHHTDRSCCAVLFIWLYLEAKTVAVSPAEINTTLSNTLQHI